MRYPRMRRFLVAVAMMLACTCVTPLRAGQAKTTMAERPTAHALPPLAEGWWEEIYGPIENALSSRETMVQFGAVGVLIGLFIIWYRRP